MTYSIIAFDKKAAQIGVALQSYYYGCAPRVVAAQPDVGIVAMQMIPDMMYGDEGLRRLAGGEDPNVILADLVGRDAARHVRQVAMIDADGMVAAYTGAGCIPFSGHVTADGLSVQGAMVHSRRVLEAIAETFQSSTGSLAWRLLRAIRSGEREGGDIRGVRAAALIVVSSEPRSSWVESRPVNIRVDDHADPLSEVERHLNIQAHMGAVELAFERGLSGDLAGSLDAYSALAHHAPDDPDVTMRYAILLAKAGDMAGARAQLKNMVRTHSGWSLVPERLVRAGLLPDKEELLSGL